MNISMAAVGSRGDIQPYLALGLGLQNAGHSIRIIADPEFKDFIIENGLSFSPITANPRKLFDEDISKIGKNIIHFAKWIKEHNKLFARQNFIELLNATDNADAIISSPFASVAFHIAESKKVPYIAAYLQPLSPTKSFSPTNLRELPAWFPFHGKINWSAYRFNSKIYLYMMKDILNECRQEILKLPALPWKVYSRADLMDNLILYGFSSHVIPKPCDWGDNIHVTGYWFLDSEDWQPPNDLVSFIHAGSPPVYVGFGSMIDKEISTIIDVVVKALCNSGQRGILSMGWNVIDKRDLPENVLLIKEAPHDWLFPKMGAVVHHGGAGTTAAGFRAGVPAVVIPFSFDQPFWGRKVHELGVGPKPIPRKKLTISNLAEAIHLAINTNEWINNSKILREKIKTDNGIANAVKIINEALIGC